MTATLFDPPQRLTITKRPYQAEDHDETFRLFDSGVVGVLTRAATGAGKTPMSCMKMDTWLNRGDSYRCMVVSYETQLVNQFALEIKDFLGIDPGIEMDSSKVNADNMPRIVVASRASLLRAQPPDASQIEELAQFGVTDIGACHRRSCSLYLKWLRAGNGRDDVVDSIIDFNRQPEVADGFYSRVHKFDWRDNWLLFFDEAHRHVHKLVSVGHIVDWFDKNPLSRRSGMTGTPKRADGVSLGDKMFPGVALDYPLFSLKKPCAVREGWAVPYIQRYIEVEGVDFKNLKMAGKDFDEDALAIALGEETTLAKLVEPLLDMVGDRRTLIFSPGVEMAKNVARYICARSRAKCPCGVQKWYASKLIGDGATCSCGRAVDPADVTQSGDTARALWGEIPDDDRQDVYHAHQSGKFQFLSVCGLCREGYNDPDVSCVAVFRPVSKKASSLAEQMKGRGCRPCRAIVALLNSLRTAEERIAAIAASDKPDCLIVDLVGITGLADCASTVSIYAEGLEDVVKELAEKLLADADEEADVQEVIEEAQQQVDDDRERIKREREEAERRAREEYEKRAKLDAHVSYTSHESGNGSAVSKNEASDKQMNFIRNLGMELICVELTKKKAGRFIDLLLQRKPLAEVARLCGLIEGQWQSAPMSSKSRQWMDWKRIDHSGVNCQHDYQQIRNAFDCPDDYVSKKFNEIAQAASGEHLTGLGRDILLAKRVLSREHFEVLIEQGKLKRKTLSDQRPIADEPE